MKHSPFLLVGIALLAPFAAGDANANFIINGSFETPVVPNGGFTNFYVGSSALTGWNVIGPSGTDVSIISGSFSVSGISFPAQDGTQWLDLTGDNSNSTEGVSQAVTTTIGDQYQLSYYVGNANGNFIGPDSIVDVSINGTPTFVDTNSIVSTTIQNWEQFTHTFVAGTSTTTLAFQNGSPSSDNLNGLDNVVLTDLGPPSAAVPEPASIGLLATGLACLALARRRSRRGESQARAALS